MTLVHGPNVPPRSTLASRILMIRRCAFSSPCSTFTNDLFARTIVPLVERVGAHVIHAQAVSWLAINKVLLV